MGLLITGGDIFIPDGVLQESSLLVEGGRIQAIGPALSPVPGTYVIDATGLLVLPGFIDLQVNGASGLIFITEPTADTLQAMSPRLAAGGCTSFLPTLLSAPLDRMAAAAGVAVRVAQEGGLSGAQVLGCHLEGPFLNGARSGAHLSEWVRPPSLSELQALLAAGEGYVRLLTLAPDFAGSEAIIAEAVRAGARVAIGHSEASAEQVASAVSVGASIVTHLFNAMPPPQARIPGIVGATLGGAMPFATIIADGVHVHPANLAAAARALGPDRLILVSDAMWPGAPASREFQFQGRTAVVQDGACYLEDGTLAGSTLTMAEAVRNMRDLAGVPAVQAVAMASANPARALGLDHRKGSLALGMDADIVLCSPSFGVVMAIVQGRIVHAAAGTKTIIGSTAE